MKLNFTQQNKKSTSEANGGEAAAGVWGCVNPQQEGASPAPRFIFTFKVCKIDCGLFLIITKG